MALGAGGPSQAVAQEAAEEAAQAAARDEEVVEEVVVVGIRGSLSSAQLMKENADTVVDGITAQDIGALSDRSVAEALQRVPGVNIDRYKKSTDPDRFSVEGADVIIRGLPFVRSELNGRDVFSATGGTVLSFNDVSPELLGGILVYKNSTADMIEGGIAGTVDLLTRKPLDTDGMRFSGSLESNYGDLEEEWSPTFSLFGSNTWDTSAGRFGLQAGYAQSELRTKSNASQVTDPCYRDDTLDGPCYRVVPVSSGGVGDELNFTPETFPPDGTVVVPKGAGVRTTSYERDREAFSLVGQWESNDGRLLVTAEYLRAEADLFVDEHAILALVNDDALFPTPAIGSDWTFNNNGTFQTGTLSQVAWRGGDPFDCLPGSLDPQTGTPPCNSTLGVPTELLRFQRQDDSVTEDYSLDITWHVNDRLSLNFEAQHVDSERSEDGIISAMQTYSDIFLDMRGETPDVRFGVPTTEDGSTDPNYFTNPDRTFYSFLLDSQIQNEGDMDTFRADLDYHVSDDGIIRDVKFGARWSDRERITRDNRFANWGVLSAPWSGFTPATYASDPTGDISSYANVADPFTGFQRGNASTPVPGGAATFFGGNNMLAEYFNGTTEQQANDIHALNPFASWGIAWQPVGSRAGLVEDVFREGEISDVGEETQAVYARVDFVFDTKMPIEGNFGVRYVETTIESNGLLQFPTIPPDPTLCQNPPPGGLPGYCSLSPEREAEFLSAFTGELIDDSADIKYDDWLPSFNIKMGVTDNFLLRAAISKGISRPDLASYATGGAFFDNTNALRDQGTLETGPMFAVNTGNRLLTPIEAWNYDISAEWYFKDVGSLTFALFKKDFEALITQGATVRDFVSDTGNTNATVEVRGPSNVEDGSMDGFELAYQQVFDFLPGVFSGLGMQVSYTYVDGGELATPEDSVTRSPFADGLPYVGISEDTVNLVAFFENDKLSARLAYNWRSEFLITPRDDIFPFSPIVGEDTGQLDGSFFYNISDSLKVGVQAVNLLDEVTRTSQVIDFDGTQMPRSAFRNDRRYTVVLRYQFE
ncbi:MAG: TonB-dependent receptor [Gammaproteobacteria bacterium]|nr:TonB-dependent receptor [Gammaproteobacteria bacterium]